MIITEFTKKKIVMDRVKSLREIEKISKITSHLSIASLTLSVSLTMQFACCCRTWKQFEEDLEAGDETVDHKPAFQEP